MLHHVEKSVVLTYEEAHLREALVTVY